MSAPEYGDVPQPGDEARVACLKSLIDKSLDTGIIADEFVRLAGIPDDLWWGGDLSLDSIFRILYKKFAPETQQYFQRAVVQAVETRNFTNDGLEEIRTLAFMASDTGTEEAVRPLARIVEKDLISYCDQEEIGHATGNIVAVIGGFAVRKSKNAQEILKEWFTNPVYERYTAIMLNGLCAASPDDYPNYLPRFLEVAEGHPEYFNLGSCIREFVRVTTLPIIQSHLGELPAEMQVNLRDLINNSSY